MQLQKRQAAQPRRPATQPTVLHIPVPPLAFSLSLGIAAVVMAVWLGGCEERVSAAVVAFWLANEFVPDLDWAQGAPTDALFAGLVLRSRRYGTLIGPPSRSPDGQGRDRTT